MAANLLPSGISFDEYLEQESKASHRSEFRAGEIHAMSGASPNQVNTSTWIAYLFLQAIGGRGPGKCRVYTADLYVYAPVVDECMLPDVKVICGELESLKKNGMEVVLNPSVVVEVLSPSTRKYDLYTKSSFYKTIGSVETILLIDSDEKVVHRHSKAGDGSWRIETFTKEEDVVVEFKSSPVVLGDIYTGIDVSDSTGQ